MVKINDFNWIIKSFKWFIKLLKLDQICAGQLTPDEQLRWQKEKKNKKTNGLIPHLSRALSHFRQSAAILRSVFKGQITHLLQMSTQKV